jgi:predicted alpha/beta superfamily hydrolase
MKHLFLSFCLLVLSNVLIGQQEWYPLPLTVGENFSLFSKELQENREVNVYLPEGYRDSVHLKYPVIYLLDGSMNEDFLHVAGLMQFLNMMGMHEPSIVIGIANVDRKRDFTYPTTIEADKKDFPTTGGSAKFISFIEEDLKPFVQGYYRMNGEETLIGQSLGGLLATEILINHPTLFDNYIIVSPSLWWDNESLLIGAEEKLKAIANGDRRISVIVGKGEHKIMRRDAKRLYRLLKKVKQKEWRVSFTMMRKENHATILHNALYRVFTR